MNTTDWQSYAALTVVGITVIAFILRKVRQSKAGGCGGGCNCEVKPKRGG